MNTKINLFDKLNSALAFAEEGDFETARSYLKAPEKKVLLAYKQGAVDKRPLEYAINVCKRVGAQLEILYIATSGSGEDIYENDLVRFSHEALKQGVENHIVTQKGCIKEEVIKYLRSHAEVVFVVADKSYQMDRDCEGKIWPDLLKAMDCPLVLVSENAI